MSSTYVSAFGGLLPSSTEEEAQAESDRLAEWALANGFQAPASEDELRKQWNERFSGEIIDDGYKYFSQDLQNSKPESKIEIYWTPFEQHFGRGTMKEYSGYQIDESLTHLWLMIRIVQSGTETEHRSQQVIAEKLLRKIKHELGSKFIVTNELEGLNH